jgi:hypothetical protein
MLNVWSLTSNDGASGTSPEKPWSNPGEVGERIGKVITPAAEPHLRTRKLAENSAEFRVLEELARLLFFANSNYRNRVQEFAKDGSVPCAEKFVVITAQIEGEPTVDLFLLTAKSHQEAQAAARTAAEANGLHPMLCFSTHLSLSLPSA